MRYAFIENLKIQNFAKCTWHRKKYSKAIDIILFTLIRNKKNENVEENFFVLMSLLKFRDLCFITKLNKMFLLPYNLLLQLSKFFRR